MAKVEVGGCVVDVVGRYNVQGPLGKEGVLC